MDNEQILSLDSFLSNANELIEQLNATHNRLILTKDGDAVAVLQNPHEYRKLRDALSMLKLMVQGENDIQAGKMKKQSEVMKNLKTRLESKGAQAV